MQILIVTGMSGAGKTQAANALEDMGVYCVDNIPPAIIPAFVDLSARGNTELGRLAIVTDIRGGNMFNELLGVLEGLKKKNLYYKILFLDASDEVLVRRYKENRRQHPLCEREDIPLLQAIKKEREMLSQVRFAANHVVDTSRISNAQLKERLSDIFLGNTQNGLKVQCKSFGFKHGADTEADIEVDGELEELINRKQALSAAQREYKEVDAQIKAIVGEREKIVTGSYLIERRAIEKNAYTVEARTEYRINVKRL